jgi:hypothetical protein
VKAAKKARIPGIIPCLEAMTMPAINRSLTKVFSTNPKDGNIGAPRIIAVDVIAVAASILTSRWH